MDDLTGPVLGITLVLMAVFIPAAFLPGFTGQLYRQFALVIASTAFISAVNALTLKPTQSALWLGPPKPEGQRNFFSRGFDAVYGRVENGYARLVGAMTRRAGLMVVLALALVGARSLRPDPHSHRVPAGRGPGLPDRSRATARRRLEGAHGRGDAKGREDRRRRARGRPVVTVSGISILDNRASLANAGVAFVVLKDWDVRLKAQGQDARTITQRLNGGLQGVPEAFSSPSRRRRSRASAMSAASACSSSSRTGISTTPCFRA